MKLYELELTLEEFLQGCTKQLLLTGSPSAHAQTQPLSIKINPGIEWLNKIQTIELTSAQEQILLILREKPHPLFQRKGIDLRYVAKLTTQEATQGCAVEVPTLGNGTRQLWFRPAERSKVILHNLGLPYSSDPKKRGNLVVQFEIDDVNIGKIYFY